MSDESWREQLPERVEPPDWVKGWVVARFRDADHRLFPEQESGYRDIDRMWFEDGMSGPSGYDWEVNALESGLMPEQDYKRYLREGASVRFSNLAELMAGKPS